MNIGIIDADLIGRKKHRFPNLACMKIAGFHRDRGDSVKLLLEYSDLDKYDKVYISKVFTDTYVDEDVLKRSNVEYGGTGFFMTKHPTCHMRLNIICLIMIYTKNGLIIN